MHKCHGKWQLIPELSFYQQGEAPQSCEYHIEINNGEANFVLSWVAADGQASSIEIGGAADDKPRDVPFPEGAQASYTMLGDAVLESRMFIGGKELAYAKRVVSDDGQLMSVLQVNMTPSGEQVRITKCIAAHKRIADDIAA